MKKVLKIISTLLFLSCNSNYSGEIQQKELKKETNHPINFSELKLNELPFGSESLLFFDTIPQIWDNNQLEFTNDGTPINEIAINKDNIRGFTYDFFKHKEIKNEYTLSNKYVNILLNNLDSLIIDLYLDVFSKELSPISYSIFNESDTIVYFTDKGKYDDFEVGELSTYINYGGLAIIENGKVVDCILLSYYRTMLYMTPFRVFYIDDNTIFILDALSDELYFSTEKRITYEIKDKKFVPK